MDESEPLRVNYEGGAESLTSMRQMTKVMGGSRLDDDDKRRCGDSGYVRIQYKCMKDEEPLRK
eukprot:7348391-Heterocapsa_arctica.AAC.2